MEIFEKFTFKSSMKLAEHSSRVEEVAGRIGIQLPSTHTAIFQSVFAKIEEPNGNGVRLDKAVVDSIPQMIGAQANLEHQNYVNGDGSSWIVGIILDAWLDAETQEINIIYSFAKNIYKDEYERALEKMAQQDLSVSFELLVGKDDIEELNDGTIRLHKVNWQGVGVLIDAAPAYANADTYAVASLYKERAEESQELVIAKDLIIDRCNKILSNKQDKSAQHLSTCEQADSDNNRVLSDSSKDSKENSLKEPKKDEISSDSNLVETRCLDCKRKLLETSEGKKEEAKGETESMTEEQKKLIADLREELGQLAEGIEDEKLLDEDFVAELRKKIESEVNSEDSEEVEDEKASEETESEEEDKEEASEDEDSEEASEEEETEEDSDEEAEDEESEEETEEEAKEEVVKTAESKQMVEQTYRCMTTFKDDGSEEVKCDVTSKWTWVDENGETMTEEVTESTDKVYKFTMADLEQAKEKAFKIAELKAKHANNEFVADFSDEDFLNEDKLERAILKKENAELKKQVEAKDSKEEETKEVEASKEENKEDQKEVVAKETNHSEDSNKNVHSILRKHFSSKK